MFLFIIFIPILISIYLVWKHQSKVTIGEYCLLFGVTICSYFLLNSIFLSISMSDTEYLGNYVTSTIYYEKWDEMVTVTHTRRVPCGTDSHGNTRYRTETYTTRERRVHPPKWCYTTSESGWEHSISESLFKKINQKMQAAPIFKDMHRHYYRIDGNAYVYRFDGKEEHCYTTTTTELYTNKVKASDHSLFKFHKLDKEILAKYPVYEYPQISELDQCPILSNNIHVSKNDIDAIKFINGYYGKKYQFRTYILLFDTIDPEIAEVQRSYWEGGNKNEFIVCLGIKNNKVIWCRPFSWSDTPTLEVKTRSYFNTHKSLNIKEYAKFLKSHLHDWHRKNFNDFKYIQIELSMGQFICIFILVFLINCGVSYWVVTNEYVVTTNKVQLLPDSVRKKLKINIEKVKKVFIQ